MRKRLYRFGQAMLLIGMMLCVQGESGGCNATVSDSGIYMPEEAGERIQKIAEYMEREFQVVDCKISSENYVRIGYEDDGVTFHMNCGYLSSSLYKVEPHIGLFETTKLGNAGLDWTNVVTNGQFALQRANDLPEKSREYFILLFQQYQE